MKPGCDEITFTRPAFTAPPTASPPAVPLPMTTVPVVRSVELVVPVNLIAPLAVTAAAVRVPVSVGDAESTMLPVPTTELASVTPPYERAVAIERRVLSQSPNVAAPDAVGN